MSRIAIEIIVGAGLFLVGVFCGVVLMCICRSNGEAERRLEKNNG